MGALINEVRERLILHRKRVVVATVLTAMLGFEGIVGIVGMARSGYSPFYAVAVRAMSQSWRAFFFGTVDRAGSITLDKAPGFLWPQALAVRVWGFHPWVLVLPQVVEGLLCIAALYLMVRPLFGRVAALLGVLALGLSPIAAGVFSHPMEDALLTLGSVAAVLCWQRGLRPGRWQSMAGWQSAAGLCVGIGFQAKMLQAWLILPPMLLGTVLVVTLSRRRRVLAYTTMLASAVVCSLSWATVFAVLPGRPFVDGTTDDNVFTMLFGYNGLDRVGSGLGGAVAVTTPPVAAADRTWAKLFEPDLYSQYGWLLPAVAVIAPFALRAAWRRRTEPGGAQRLGQLAAWASWLILVMLELSATGVPHTAYVAACAAPLAALAAGCLPYVREQVQARTGSALLAAAVLATAGVGAYEQRAGFANFLPWLPALVLVIGLGAAALMIRSGGRLALVAVAVTLLAMPAAWTLASLHRGDDGSANDASAGPGGLRSYRADARVAGRYRISPATGRERALLGYLDDHGGRTRYALVSNSWQALEPYQIAAREEFLPIGGFGGHVPNLSPAGFDRLVDRGQARYFLLDDGRVRRRALGRDSVLVADEVIHACDPVRPMSDGTLLTNPGDRLYECSDLGSGPDATDARPAVSEGGGQNAMRQVGR